MKTISTIATVAAIVLLTSCKKNKCYECHYDGPNGEVEIGEKCGDDVKNLEQNGFVTDSVTYEAHCGEH